MKNKVILAIIILLILGISIPIILDNGGKNKSTVNNSLLQSIPRVRENAKMDMEKAREQYKNMDLTGVIPVITSKNSIKLLKQRNDNYHYKGINNQMEMFNEELNLIKYHLGDNVDTSNIICTSNRIEFDECLKQINEGTYKSFWDNMPFLCYSSKSSENNQERYYQYIHVDPGFSDIWMDKGKIYNMSNKNSVVPERNLETYKFYYAHDDSVNLDDRYNLLNGSMSVREGINFIENYMNKELPYIEDNGVKKVVDSVEVKKFTENAYVFVYHMTRSYNELEFMCSWAGSMMPRTRFDFDISSAAMCDTNDVDFYFGRGANGYIKEEGEEISQILPVSEILKIVSDRIGENSVYKINKLKLIYRMDVDGNVDELKNTGNIYWLVSGINNNDNMNTYFFVNALNGKLDYAHD